MALDTSALEQAIQQLEIGLDRAKNDPSDELIRDGVIQRFEYTYELSHKTIKRYLEMTEASPDIMDNMTFAEMIRLGSERGILRSGWDTWRQYRTARGTTSHTYDKSKAQEVFEQIPEFLAEARSLLSELTKRAEKT